VVALLTAMDQPIGQAIGNACELAEAIDVLRGGGPADTRALTVRFGAEMLILGRRARDLAEGTRRIEAAIGSGAGLEKLRLCVRLQGGDVRVIDEPQRLPRARHEAVVQARRAGFVTSLDAGALGRAATRLGAGRARKEDPVDAGVGIALQAKEGDAVERGAPLAVVRYTKRARFEAVRASIEDSFTVGAARPRARPLILERID